MKNIPLLSALLLLCGMQVNAQKDTCVLGIYINNVYDFRVDDKSFMADFWMWMNYKNDSLHFESAAEITNSKSSDFSHFTMEKKGTSIWAAQKCRAQIIHQWDVSKFPFDKQVMQIIIEDSQYDTSSLIYAADQVNSKFDPVVNSGEWSVDSFSIKEFVRTYQTTYGNPRLSGKSAYPGIVASLTMKRNDSWTKLLKMLTGVYVAFLISCIVFFVSSANQDSRFGLCVGGIFAAIGNKYIVESIVPSSSANTLMDNVHTLTFIFIFIIIIIITISLRLFESGDEKKIRNSIRLDTWSFYTLGLLYILMNAALLFVASH